MTDTAPPVPTDLKTTLDEMRASAAVAKGLSGTIHRAILRVFDALVMLLAELRARRDAEAPVAEDVRSVEIETGPAPTPHPAPQGGRKTRCTTRASTARSADSGDLSAVDADSAFACPSPSRIGPHSCQQKWEPVAGPFHRIRSGGKPASEGRWIACGTVFLAMAECARHAPGFSALRGSDSKNGVLGAARARDLFVTISK